MNVRMATETDLPRINELRRQVNELHVEGRPDVFRPGFGQELQDYVNVLFAGEGHEILVAENEDGIVGFACLKYIDRPESPYRKASRFVDIEEIAVDSCCRRQGAGRLLVDAVRARARETGYARIELNMWEFNENALAFYERIGFRTYRRYMELDAD